MIDYKKLIERLYNSHDAETLCADAAGVIQALTVERDALQAQSNERGALAIANGIRMERAEAERDTLAAKLDILKSALERVVKPEALTEGYAQRVPDKCDKIVWRGNYYHLPIHTAKALATLEADAERYRWLRNTSQISARSTGKGIAFPHYVTSEMHRCELDAAIDAAKGGQQ
jgi:hypothetical protein